MKFAILTTTYNRPLLLMRAVSSVRTQTHTDYMHIIINDSPLYDYEAVESDIVNDNKILYIKNQSNMGKNYSLNIALDYLKNNKFEGYVIYLDDDDWLVPECLADFKNEIEKNPNCFWFVSNRVLVGGEGLTKNNTDKKFISYFYHYLLFKKFAGDATHCIKFSPVSKAHYPNHIKNGEEWYYFLSISKDYKKFLHIDKAGTYSQGYSFDGLNSHMKYVYSTSTRLLFKEKWSFNMLSYLVIRTFYLMYKKIF